MIHYKPFDERKPDPQYHWLLEDIMENGEDISAHGVMAKKLIGYPMRFKFPDGFPVITERDLASPPKSGARPSPFHQAIGEICAFINGAQTQAELEKFGCYWWADWVSPEEAAKKGLAPGDLGPASYGAAWRRFPTPGEPFDQIVALLKQIRDDPGNRYHELTPWIPYLLLRPDRKAAVPPCHGWVHLHINPLTRQLTLSARQRSADVPVGFVFNLIHYAALALMFSQVTGYEAKELVYYLEDAHIYKNQFDDVRAMLSTEPQPLPTVTVDPTITDLFAFQAHHFTITDYHPQLEARKIPTPL